ncbi:hypothetical protein L9F63_018374, partial [Diploptera punctata]
YGIAEQTVSDIKIKKQTDFLSFAIKCDVIEESSQVKRMRQPAKQKLEDLVYEE